MMWNIFSKKIDPAKAYAGNFHLAFTYLPQLIERYKRKQINFEALYTPNIWKKDLKDDDLCQYDWKNTKANLKTLNEKLQFITIGFSPKGNAIASPEVGIIIIDSVRDNISYYTLEGSFGGYAICKNENGEHLNFGIIKSGPNFFTEALKRILENEGLGFLFGQ